jgi:hypothetical protein
MSENPLDHNVNPDARGCLIIVLSLIAFGFISLFVAVMANWEGYPFPINYLFAPYDFIVIQPLSLVFDIWDAIRGGLSESRVWGFFLASLACVVYSFVVLFILGYGYSTVRSWWELRLNLKVVWLHVCMAAPMVAGWILVFMIDGAADAMKHIKMPFF